MTGQEGWQRRRIAVISTSKHIDDNSPILPLKSKLSFIIHTIVGTGADPHLQTA